MAGIRGDICSPRGGRIDFHLVPDTSGTAKKNKKINHETHGTHEIDEDKILFVITNYQKAQDLFAEPWSPLAPPKAGKLSCI
mgnify:CR=1 FL=1